MFIFFTTKDKYGDKWLNKTDIFISQYCSLYNNIVLTTLIFELGKF